jgi:hypothetical protein
MRQLACAKATDSISTKTSNAAAAKATHVTAVKATHVTSTKATHVASAKAAHAAATMSSASAASAAAGLRTRGKKATGKQGACQNHHHSSSHDILHRVGRTFRHRAWSNVGVSQQSKANVAMGWRWRRLFVFSTKFAFIRIECRVYSEFRPGMTLFSDRTDAIVIPLGQQERPPPLSH